jgi:hypothetical protein
MYTIRSKLTTTVIFSEIILQLIRSFDSFQKVAARSKGFLEDTKNLKELFLSSSLPINPQDLMQKVDACGWALQKKARIVV